MADFKSTDLLNAIRNGASAEYIARVPLATKENIASVGTAILDQSYTRNEFVSALLNKIGLSVIKGSLFENPLQEFKNGTLNWGKDIEEIFVDLITAQAFDSKLAETELFKKNMPKISAIFHSLNRQDQYKTTVSIPQLKTAFMNGDNGFNSLIDKIVSVMYTSDNYDEFLIMKNLIKQYGIEGKFAMVAVAPVVDDATARLAMTKIKEISNDLTFMKTTFNHAGVTTNTPKNEQIVLINTKFDAVIDVELLASAFNMSKADFDVRRVLIDDFGGLENVLCAIVDKDWFMVYDNLLTSEEIYNPSGLYYNYFLHHWQVMSTSQFANAVLFVTVEPELTALTLTPATATVAKGGSVQFVVEATGTGNPPSKVKYTHDGTDTYISSTGLMIVGKGEAVVGGDITVTATSIFDDTISNTAVITVV